MEAAFYGQVNKLRELVEAGADPSAHDAHAGGASPLHAAACGGHAAAIEDGLSTPNW